MATYDTNEYASAMMTPTDSRTEHLMAFSLIHVTFDLIAALFSFLLSAFVYHWRLRLQPGPLNQLGQRYVLALIMGAVVGGYGFGTFNLIWSGHAGVGRSVLGALIGAILTVELYKKSQNIHGSTGILFVPGLSLTLVIGRLGCFFSGLDDFTYGNPSSVPWARDFGDGILRHPVQLYESLTMATFLAVFLFGLKGHKRFAIHHGFYWFSIIYASQRFFWEFLKPYAVLVGPFNIFHLGCLALLPYGIVMLKRSSASHHPNPPRLPP